MAGLISSTNKGGKLSPDRIASRMHLTPKQKTQMQRIVVAGQKVMFSKQSHHLLLEQLKGPGTIAQKLGQGVGGLLGYLMQESRGSLPQELLIPAGMVLIAIAADFLQKSGENVSEQDIGEAMNVLVRELLNAGGIDPDKVASIAASGRLPAAKSTQGKAPTPAQAPAPAATGAQAMPAQPGGMA
jgi:hypothetical protein